jgi:hypothetical protein
MKLFTWLAGLLPNRGRFISSVYSRDRLYHRIGCDCPYCASIHPENIVKFKTKRKAEERGLHICRVCSQRIQQKSIRDYT